MKLSDEEKQAMSESLQQLQEVLFAQMHFYPSRGVCWCGRTGRNPACEAIRTLMKLLNKCLPPPDGTVMYLQMIDILRREGILPQ